MEYYKSYLDNDDYDKVSIRDQKRYARSIQIYENEEGYNNNLEVIEKDNYICCKCFKTENNYGFFILQCGHLYHINCIIDDKLNDLYRINNFNEYVNNIKCEQCKKVLTKNELMYVFNRYNDITIDNIKKYENEIKNLEEKFEKIKQELGACYEYKHQLNTQIETTKHIIKTLISII